MSYGCSPLFFELAVEKVYPASEAVVGFFLNMCWNVVSVTFLILFQIFKGVVWMDYILFIQGIIAFVFMLLFKEEYNRSKVDKILTENEIEVDAESLDDNSVRSRTSYGSV